MEIVCRISSARKTSNYRLVLTIIFALVAAICSAKPQTTRIVDTPTPPSSLYRSALIKERALRTPGSVPATDADYTKAIAAFIRVAKESPDGTYAPQALWQAAGLCLAAFERWHDDSFVTQGATLLTQLASDYSHSPLSHRVPERLKTFETVHSYGRLIRLSKDLVGDTIRYTLELNHETEFVTRHLGEPTRVFFDLSDTTIPDNLDIARSSDGKPEPTVRIGRRKNNITRVVLDLP